MLAATFRLVLAMAMAPPLEPAPESDSDDAAQVVAPLASDGAVALGTVTIITTRLADGLASTHLRAATTREAGLWTGTAAILAGASLLGYGATYRATRTMLDRAFQVRVAPVISRELVGVGVSGRF